MQLVEIEYLGEYLPNKNHLDYISSKVNKSGIADINILLNHGCGNATKGRANRGGLCNPSLNVNQVCHGGTRDPQSVANVCVHEIGHSLGKLYKTISILFAYFYDKNSYLTYFSFRNVS